MKRVINWLKNVRPVKILTVFLAGVFLVLTQACSSGIAAQPPQPSAQPSSPNSAESYTKRYDPTKSYDLNEPKGGMNNFSDVDPRAKAGEKSAEARAKALRDNAQRNVDQKGIDSTGQYVENYRQGTPLGQRVKNLGEDVGSSAGEFGQGVAKGTKRGIENIKDNTQNATQDLTKNVQRGAENAKINAQRGVEDAKINVQRSAEDAADAMKQTVR
ncbi:DUF6658 family protein [Halotia wernerae UHCC 0503]|nr:DUF6658 family protein [Halotia wernerae UHCC 0503]